MTAIAGLIVFIVVLLMVMLAPTADAADEHACWGQATKVFAATGEMGEHSSSFETPRIGIRNLARVLADAGIIPDDSMAALGAFVADELGLSVEVCE